MSGRMLREILTKKMMSNLTEHDLLSSLHSSSDEEEDEEEKKGKKEEVIIVWVFIFQPTFFL